jgi:ElaB/YqjD/DUF883 family membrane-anchored ribosome-binding protein
VTETVVTAAREAFNGRVGPALRALEENIRQVRRAVVHGRHAAEDLAASAALRVRRRPLGAVATALGAGLAVGALVGFLVGRPARPKS